MRGFIYLRANVDYVKRYRIREHNKGLWGDELLKYGAGAYKGGEGGDTVPQASNNYMIRWIPP